jgi:hypothetical protein
MASEQGVRQVCPVEVRASAPAGSDSNCIVVAVGAGLDFSKPIQPGMLEHAETVNPHAATTTHRFMIDTIHSCDPRRFQTMRMPREVLQPALPLAARPAAPGRRSRRKTVFCPNVRFGH